MVEYFKKEAVHMKTIEVETHDGEKNIIELEEYNASAVAEAINNSREEHVIVFGDYIFSKINIKTIKPVYKAEEDEVEK